MNTKSAFKTLIEKAFDDSLKSSQYLSKVIDNIIITANEAKKLANLVLKMNDRINQHERMILTLLDIVNEKDKDKVGYSLGSKNEPTKPN